MEAHAAATTATELLGVTAMLQSLSRRVVARWADFDLLLTPSLAQRPVPIGAIDGGTEGDEDPLAPFHRATAFAPYAALFNVTGQPAITLPAGIAEDGLPATVQLVGSPLAEETLLQVAAQLEQARPWAALRPPAAA
jgi:amidase